MMTLTGLSWLRFKVHIVKCDHQSNNITTDGFGVAGSRVQERPVAI